MCRNRDYAFILGNSKTDYAEGSLIVDGTDTDIVIAGLVEYDTSGSDVGFIAALDSSTCLASLFYRLQDIVWVDAVRASRVSTKSYFYLVGYDSSDSEHMFKFDTDGKYQV